MTDQPETSPSASGPSAPGGSASAEAALRRRRIRGRLSAGRRLARIAYRDPEHVAERLDPVWLGAASGSPSLAWARWRPGGAAGRFEGGDRRGGPHPDRAGRAHRWRGFRHTVPDRSRPRLPRLPVAGRASWSVASPPSTGRDPREARYLRADRWSCAASIRPSRPLAQSCSRGRRRPRCPDKPTARRPLRTWVRSVYVLLIFGGFLSAPDRETPRKRAHWRLKAAVGFVVGGVDLGHDLGLARQLHDRHGLGL